MNWQDEKSQLQKLISESEAALMQITRDARGPDDDEAAMNYASEAGRLAFMRARLAHVENVADDETAQMQAHAQRVQDALQPAINATTAEINYWGARRRDLQFRLKDGNPYRVTIAEMQREIDAAAKRIDALTPIAEKLPANPGQIGAAMDEARRWLAELDAMALPLMDGTIETARIYDEQSARRVRVMAYMRTCESVASGLHALGVAIDAPAQLQPA
jgi:hypothetical protein